MWPFKHKCKWATKGRNKWGLSTYKICQCGKAKERTLDGWRECKRIPELDNQCVD